MRPTHIEAGRFKGCLCACEGEGGGEEGGKEGKKEEMVVGRKRDRGEERREETEEESEKRLLSRGSNKDVYDMREGEKA